MIWGGRILHGALGMAVLVAVAVAFSAQRGGVRVRLVASALALQVAVGALALFVPAGRDALGVMSRGVDAVLSYGRVGMDFVFGGLGQGQGDGFVFALRVLPQIVYISALIEILFYLGVVQRVAALLGRGLALLIGCTRINAFAAIVTIFLGQSELPIAIRPAIARMSRPELFGAMASGTASVAGSVLAGYAALGVRMEDLLAASFMAIPGGLLFGGILMPTRGPSDPAALDRDRETDGLANIFDAVAVGTARGVRVAVMVGAMLIAFIGLIALADGALGEIGRVFGSPRLTLEAAFGRLFAPVAALIGVPWRDAADVGRLIGEKLVFNEFVGYVHLHDAVRTHRLSDTRSISIAGFALCGFANFSSVAILLAAFGSVAGDRRSEIARLAMRAVLAGTLSNLMSADIAGMFLTPA